MTADREEVRRNVEDVRSRIAAAATRSGRTPGDVSLIAVTKTVEPEQVRWAIEAGVRRSRRELRAGAARQARRDRRRHVALHRHASVEHGPPRRRPCRCRPDGGGRACGATARGPRRPLRPHARLVDRGGSHGRPDGRARDRAPRLRGLGRLTRRSSTDRSDDRARDRGDGRGRTRLLRPAPWAPGRDREEHPDVLALSMGMSLDYEVAVEEGATMVRIGTALFGSRRTRPPNQTKE